MKKILLLAALPVFSLITLNSRGAPLEASGQAVFTLTAIAQSTSDVITSVRTNHTATTTNITTVTKSKATNAPIDSEYILSLLANSFKTNLPSGAKLIMSGAEGFSFLVVDSSGSNVLLDASGVLSISDNLSVESAVETFIQTTSRTGTRNSGNSTETFTEYATLNYNDTALTTADGTHTSFQLSGVLVDMVSTNIKTIKTTESVTLHGTGAGTIQGKNNVILKGTVTATLAGVLLS